MHKKNLLKLSYVGMIVFGIASASANANNCSIIKVSGGEINGNDYIAEVVGHNGVTVRNNPRKYRSISRGEYPYYLEEGEHTINLKLWKKRQYLKYKAKSLKAISGNFMTDNKRAKVETQDLNFFVNIKAENTYSFNIATDGNNNPTVILNTIAPQKCALEQNKLFNAKNTSEKRVLPEHLTTRWAQLTSKLKQNSVIYSPINFSTSIGFSASNNGNVKDKITFVAPKTFAEKIGLKTNDIIVSLGESSDNSSSDNTDFSKYMQKISLGEKIIITVQRDGALIKLSEEYIPDVIPEATYELYSNSSQNRDVINTKKLDEKLQVELNQLLIESSDYFITQGLTNRIFIEVPNSRDNQTLKMGIDLKSLVAMRSYLVEMKNAEPLYQGKQYRDASAGIQARMDSGARIVEMKATNGSQ